MGIGVAQPFPGWYINRYGKMGRAGGAEAFAELRQSGRAIAPSDKHEGMERMKQARKSVRRPLAIPIR